MFYANLQRILIISTANLFTIMIPIPSIFPLCISGFPKHRWYILSMPKAIDVIRNNCGPPGISS